MVVLDTDHLSILEWPASGDAQRLRERLRTASWEQAAATIISFEEQMRGWLAYLARAGTLAKQVEAYGRLLRHLENFREIDVLPFDERAAAELQRLTKLRLRLGTMDLKIAAVVFAHDATLLTRNTADFRKVPGLRIEDWTK